MLMRAISGQLVVIAWQAGALFIPFGLHTLVIVTYPFMASILAVLVNKEAFNTLDLFCMLICFGFVTMFTLQKPDQSKSYIDTNYPVGLFFSLSCALCYSVSMITTRKLQEVNILVILFWHMLFGLFLSTVWLVTDYAISGEIGLLNLDAKGTKWLLIACLFDGLGMACQVKALQLAKTSTIGMVGYVTVVYAFTLDYLINGQTYTWLQMIPCFGILVTAFIFSLVKLSK